MRGVTEGVVAPEDTVAALRREVAELRQSEQRYRLLVEQQTELISRFAADDTITFVNDAFCRYFNKRREELVGQKWHPAALSEDLPFIRERLRILSPACPVVTIENRIISATGEIRWVQFVNRGFFDGEERLLEVQGVGRDITERKQAELRIRLAEQFARTTIDSLTAAICVLEEDGTIITVNQAWRGFFRENPLVPNDGFVGGNYLTLSALGHGVAAAEAAQFAAGLRGMMRGARTTFRMEYACHSPTEERWFLVIATRFTVEGLFRVVVTHEDITAVKLAEDALRRYSRRLVEAEEEARKKLARVLHDEIGPELTDLGIILALIRQNLPPEELEKLGDRFEDSGVLIENITRTVRGVMAELRPPVLDDYGLPAALRWQADLMAKRTGFRVEVRVDDLFPRLTPDRETALFRISQEALTNSVKHAAARHATISLRCRNGLVRLVITDDGRGFAPPTTSFPRKKSTMGLTLMRERAEAFGGRFQLASEPGEGVTVIVELPLER